MRPLEVHVAGDRSFAFIEDLVLAGSIEEFTAPLKGGVVFSKAAFDLLTHPSGRKALSRILSDS